MKTEEEKIEAKRLYDIEYRAKNKELRNKKAKEYRESNKEKFIQYRLKYKEIGDDNIKEYVKIKKQETIKNRKLNEEKTKDRIRKYNKNYEKINKEKLRKKANIRKINRKNSDLKYKLTCNISSLITNSFKNKRFRKNTNTIKILGCSVIEFKEHLEKQFETWMNWKNHGLYNSTLNYGWDIDHIIPLSSAKTIEEVVLLNHYTNLQPLCSKVNRDIKRHNF